jgi:uncharacterized membrane protein (UPF0127 family)
MTRNSLAAALLAACLCAPALALKVPPGAASAELALPDGFRVSAELALTPDEQARGLMDREALAPDRGMLFVFRDYAPRHFWMKNTWIDLDMVFLDADLKVLKVFHRVPRSVPGQSEQEVARASAPAALVLELAAGTARAHKVKPGARLKISFPKK